MTIILDNLNLNTETGKAYAAGFIDADGAFVAKLVPREDYRLKHKVTIEVQITQHQSRIALLNHFHEHYGLGYVRKRKNTNIADWVVTAPDEVKRVLQDIKPYLVLKYKQAVLVEEISGLLLAGVDDVDKLLEIAKLVDGVALLNKGKNRVHSAESVAKTLRDLGLMN